MTISPPSEVRSYNCRWLTVQKGNNWWQRLSYWLGRLGAEGESRVVISAESPQAALAQFKKILVEQAKANIVWRAEIELVSNRGATKGKLVWYQLADAEDQFS